MKKTATFFALSLASTLLANCPNGNCGYNQGYNQGYQSSQNGSYQSRDGSYQGPQQSRQYDNRGSYDNNRNDGYYDNRNHSGNYDNRNVDSSNIDSRNIDSRNVDSRNIDNRYENRDNRYDGYAESRPDNHLKGSDQEISQKIHDTLSAGWMSSGYPNVSYDVNNGNVTLRGGVETADDKAKIEDKIRKLDGVRQINNQITVSRKNTAYNDADSATKVRSADQKYPQDSAASDADRALNAKIRDKLSGWFTNDYEEVVLNTKNGVVTITGFVEKYDDIQKVNDKLKDVNGIKSVNNQLSSRRSQ